MRRILRPLLVALVATGVHGLGMGQTPLPIPLVLTGDTISLTLQAGTRSFYPGTSTPTFGANGAWMAPTVRVTKGDTVTLMVTNQLGTSSTIHWHGLHVAPEHDGGPHQVIFPNATWSPRFEVKNEAGTFWYHPHGEGKTDLHVSKGIAGFFLIDDSVEAALPLPRDYGVDDFPIVIQSKEFDVVQQVAIAGHQDTALFVNGALSPVLSAPAQVVRLRLLNGSSMRSYLLGFDGNRSFALIANDGGLLAAPLPLTRLRLSPGERAEVLVDLGGLQGQSVQLRNYGSELPTGVYGAAVVGNGMAVLPGYDTNPRNGADYDILAIDVAAPTGTPVTSVPTALVNLPAMDSSGLDTHRTFLLEPMAMGAMEMIEGPFGINGVQFDMGNLNVTTYLGNKEVWRLRNTTLVAHPFHVHDVQFRVANVNGDPTPAYMSGLKDVVLVMPMSYVDIVMTFEDFADPSVPYMYHCHMLHHEDEGMMGQFVVLDTTVSGLMDGDDAPIRASASPNPSEAGWRVVVDADAPIEEMQLLNAWGQVVERLSPIAQGLHLETSVGDARLAAGVYFLQMRSRKGQRLLRLVKL